MANTITPVNMVDGTQLTNAATTIYTALSGQIVQIKKAVFTNTDVSAHTVTVHLVASGGTPSTANKIISGVSVSAGQSYVASELSNQVMSPGMTLSAFADTGAVVGAFVSGLAVS